MIHLIWSALNGIIVLYFLYLLIGFIVKGKQIFNTSFKVISIVVFLSGVLQIISASKNPKIENFIIISDDVNPQNRVVLKKIILEDNLSFNINMLLEYSVGKNEYIPIKSNSFLTGFVSGYQWEFKSIKINNFKPNEKVNYKVHGLLEWKLFGIIIYTESKIFEGEINKKSNL